MRARDFAPWLAGEMQRQGVSQRLLGQASGVDHSSISRLLNGTRAPLLGTVVVLAKSLGYDLVLVPSGLHRGADAATVTANSEQQEVSL